MPSRLDMNKVVNGCTAGLGGKESDRLFSILCRGVRFPKVGINNH